MKNYISGWTKPTIPSTSMLLSPHWSMSGLANKHKYEQNDVIASVGLIKVLAYCIFAVNNSLINSR